MTGSVLLRLTLEETKGLARSRFGLAGAALLLGLVLTLVLGMWVSSRNHVSVLAIHHSILPTLLIPVAAWQVAHARASRFMQAVFTTPVTAAQYLAARVLAVVALGLLGVATLLPYYAVHALHAQLPPEAWRMLGVGVGNVVACTALGTLVGVLFTQRGAVAALGAGIAVAVVSIVGLVLLPEVLAARPSLMRDAALRLLNASPPHLLSAALGAHLMLVSKAPLLAGLAVALLAALALGVSFWAFTRLQGPEGWELPSRGAAVALALAVAAVAVAPAATASVDYGPATQVYGGGDNGAGTNVTAALVDPGTPADAVTAPGWTHGSRPIGRELRLDLLVAFHPPWLEPQPAERLSVPPLRDVTLALEGDRVRVLEGARTRVEWPQAEPTWRAEDEFVTPVQVLRVPVRVLLDEPTHLTNEPYRLWLNASYDMGNGTLHGVDDFLVIAEVPGAAAQMALAGLPAPLACLALLTRRAWRMRP